MRGKFLSGILLAVLASSALAEPQVSHYAGEGRIILPGKKDVPLQRYFVKVSADLKVRETELISCSEDTKRPCSMSTNVLKLGKKGALQYKFKNSQNLDVSVVDLQGKLIDPDSFKIKIAQKNGFLQFIYFRKVASGYTQSIDNLNSEGKRVSRIEAKFERISESDYLSKKSGLKLP